MLDFLAGGWGVSEIINVFLFGVIIVYHFRVKHYRGLAYVDPLSNLRSRRFGLDVLDRILRDVKHERADCVVMLIDIDLFKTVNDAFGHAAGDMAIELISRSLQAGIRPTDVAIRWAGDEILIVLRDDKRSTDFQWLPYEKLAERLRERVENLTFADYPELRVSISLGLAAAIRGQSITALNLVAQADGALYQAKKAGRNCVRTAEVKD